MTRTAAYLRVSTEEQANEGLNLQAQELPYKFRTAPKARSALLTAPGAPRRPAAKARRKCLYLLVPVLRRNAGSGDGSVMPATWSEFVGKLPRGPPARLHRHA